MRKNQEENYELEDLDDENEDAFDKVYKGEISKSGTAVLPSKRVRRVPEKNIANLKKLEEKTNIEIDNKKETDLDKKTEI